MAGFWTRPLRETLAMSGGPKAQRVGEWANNRAEARDTKIVSKSQKKTSHTFHLLMTLFTGGLWGLVWIGMIVWHHFGPRRKTVTRLPGSKRGSDQVTAVIEFESKGHSTGA